MSHHFRALPQSSHTMENSTFPIWAEEQDSIPLQYYNPYTESFGVEDDAYLADYDHGIISMQPMQRFILDQGPLTDRLLNSKTSVYDHFEKHYEQQWPSSECFRNISPDRTSASDNSTYNTQNELCSPNSFLPCSYSSPIDFPQPPFLYPSTEHFHGGGLLSETRTPGRSISLRDLEYEHPEPEPLIEDVDCTIVKHEVVCDTETIVVDLGTRSNHKYADSGIGNSVRDAESVQPIDMQNESMSDSEYEPSPSRSARRRWRSTSHINTSRVQKRRGASRKAFCDIGSAIVTKTPKKCRKASINAKNAIRLDIQPDDRRAFPCPLATYGCNSSFTSKNEWKRHISTQHIKIGFWRCDLCIPTTDPQGDEELHYNDFNRKDLFTQHLRRMHSMPKNKPSRGHKEYPVNDDNLPDHQIRCFLALREAPQQSNCLFCNRTFQGPRSWDERIEHIGRHLEKDREDDSDMLDCATWIADEGLEKYLLNENLISGQPGAWKIDNGRNKRRNCV